MRPESIRQQTSVPWIEDHILFFNDWPFDISAFSQDRQARIFLGTPPSHARTNMASFPPQTSRTIAEDTADLTDLGCRAAHGLDDRIVHPVFSSALKRQMPNAHLELIPGVPCQSNTASSMLEAFPTRLLPFSPRLKADPLRTLVLTC